MGTIWVKAPGSHLNIDNIIKLKIAYRIHLYRISNKTLF